MLHILSFSMLSTAIGIGGGGVLAWLLKGYQRSLSKIYAICAGMILAILLSEIIPEGIELGNFKVFILGVTTGIIIFELLHRMFHNVIQSNNNYQKKSLIYTGMLLSLSISLHNFPIGISLGATNNTSIRKSLVQTIILHNIPEGIIMFLPLFLAGLGFLTWLLLTIFSTLPIAIGAFVGTQIGIDNTLLWSYILALAVGIIFMVTIKEIFLVSIKKSYKVSIMISLLSFILTFIYFYMV
ncbi:ZIP family metal transporter [Peribacillus acanthi]|uniref:ZIP family metal transporter n=1 Tax=Peribacillus acanthi TaxID=2171554 RepID=UPI000D3EAB40|nr:ZIP family metal transporter [Peribacillus acanthi]